MKILFIPHYSKKNLLTRTIALAKATAKSTPYKIFILKWETSDGDISYMEKFKIYFKNITQIKINKEKNLYTIQVPCIIKPLKVAQIFNTFILSCLIKFFKFDLIVNASVYYFTFSEKRNFFYIYDIVDDHLAFCLKKNLLKYRLYIEKQLSTADKVITVSNMLYKKIQQQYKILTTPIYNGADVESIRKKTIFKDKGFSEKYKLNNCKVIGYIGNHGAWSGMNFLIETFKKANCIARNMKLLIVGPCYENYIKSGDANIIFAGRVSPTLIPMYLSLMDIGVIPFEKSPFTDNAFPIKAIEYGAARLPVISTPLEELKTHNLPFISFASTSAEWQNKLISLSKNNWKNDWDRIVDKYDWRVHTNKLLNLLNL